MKIYLNHLKPFIIFACLLILAASCKKEKYIEPAVNNFAAIGLYLESVDYFDRRVFIHIAQLGNVNTSYFSEFDTGSAGMVIDGNGILPASMITDHGFIVPKDSIVYNGITVTNHQTVLTYGEGASATQVYGNLAYATVTLGENTNTVTTKRIPFILYFRAVYVSSGAVYSPHLNDIFGVALGVNPIYSTLESPLSHINMPAGVDPGFKIGILDSAKFTLGAPNYVPGLLTIGLTQKDVFSSGFVLHASNVIKTNITYNNKQITGNVLFDSGSPGYSTIKDPSATNSLSYLNMGTKISISSPDGFNYTYTTGLGYNLTTAQSPSPPTISPVSIFSIDFFTHNEYLVDYFFPSIGLKNN